MQHRPLELRRFSGYASWMFAAEALPLAAMRLLFQPLLNGHLGEENFGAFIWALSVVELVGTVVISAARIHILRDLAGRSAQSAAQLMRSDIVLTLLLLAPSLTVVSWVTLGIAPEIVRANVLAIYLPLVMFSLTKAVYFLLLIVLRVRRSFHRLFCVRLTETATLVFAILLLEKGSIGVRGAGAVYLASVLVPLPVTLYATRVFLANLLTWRPLSVKASMSGLGPAMVVTALEQAELYAARIVLGALGGTATELTVFFAGASINNMFLVPSRFLSNFLFSLIASNKNFAFDGQRLWLYAAVTGLFAVGTGGVSYVVGPWLIAKLYPNVASETILFYHWLVISSSFLSVAILVKPLPIKYASMFPVTCVSAGVLATNLCCLFVLVPQGQARGAAIAMAISSFTGAVLWLTMSARVYRAAQRKGGGSPD